MAEEGYESRRARLILKPSLYAGGGLPACSVKEGSLRRQHSASVIRIAKPPSPIPISVQSMNLSAQRCSVNITDNGGTARQEVLCHLLPY